MSNELVSWEDRLKKDAVAIQDAYKSPIGTVSFSSAGMFYEGAPVEGNKLSVVTLAAAFVNLWYKDTYDPDVRKNPDCYAISQSRIGMKPDPTATDIQSPVCDGCPMLRFRTDPVRGRAKWCKEKMRLIMLPGGRAKDAGQIANSELAQCTLPVMSVKNWMDYAQSLGGGIWVVVTEMKWVPDKKTQFKVQFSLQGQIDDSAVKSAIAGRLDAATAHIMAPYPVAEETPAAPASDKKKKY